ncbi:AraC family transcriptional regulator [Paenibacillus sp. OV219]|uniref:helix-turn-helix transcriptional regulator n=1 Tax=Paenibacillus sp. OV219 TaxID=1884377 RepID=UPI0008AC17B3|nr:AraC family transcriptional regulator [Paenibacillus sp. OV219]SEN05811.1 AraC-type DNA-binding protein [Paenibacillus sp. OV219]
MATSISPAARPTTLRELSPVIHWAQPHNRAPAFKWSRRIYDFQLLYVKHGELRATIEGEASLKVRAGSLLILPPWLHHRIEVLSEPYAELLGVHFDFFETSEVTYSILVDEQAPNVELLCHIPYLQDKPIFMELLFNTVSPRIISLLENIIQEWNEKQQGYEVICSGLMVHLITLLVRHQNERRGLSHPKYEKQLLQLAEEIRSDFSRRWTSAEMAKYLNVHEDYMSRQFKSMMGIGPKKFVQSVRHQEAKRLLRETDQTIESISAAVGYEDFHYFSRIFKRWEGMSAMQFRKLSRMI